MDNCVRSILSQKIRCQILLKWLKIARKSSIFRHSYSNSLNEYSKQNNNNNASQKRVQACKLMVDYLQRSDLFNENESAHNNQEFLLNLIEIVLLATHFSFSIKPYVESAALIDDKLIDLCRRKVNEYVSIPSSYSISDNYQSNYDLNYVFNCHDQSSIGNFCSIFRRIGLLFPTDFNESLSDLMNGIHDSYKTYQQIFDSIHQINCYSLCINFYDIYPNDGLTLGSQNFASFILLTILFDYRYKNSSFNLCPNINSSFIENTNVNNIEYSIELYPIAYGPGLKTACLNVETHFDIIYPSDDHPYESFIDDTLSERMSMLSTDEQSQFPISINISIIKDKKNGKTTNGDISHQDSQPMINIYKSIASKSIFRVVYIATSYGTCIIDILINNIPIMNSPWKFNIQELSDENSTFVSKSYNGEFSQEETNSSISDITNKIQANYDKLDFCNKASIS